MTLTTDNPFPVPAEEQKTWLLRLSYEDAETAMFQGRMSADDWDWYCWEWRNSVFRFSNVASGYDRSHGSRGMA